MIVHLAARCRCVPVTSNVRPTAKPMVLLFAQRGSSARSPSRVLGSRSVVAACVGTQRKAVGLRAEVPFHAAAGAVPSPSRKAVGLGAVGLKLSGMSRWAFESCSNGRCSAPSVKAVRPVQLGGCASNRSIDTDVLSAGFAGLLSTGHLSRWASLS